MFTFDDTPLLFPYDGVSQTNEISGRQDHLTRLGTEKRCVLINMEVRSPRGQVNLYPPGCLKFMRSSRSESIGCPESISAKLPSAPRFCPLWPPLSVPRGASTRVEAP